MALFSLHPPLAAQVWPKTSFVRPHGALRGSVVEVHIHGTGLGTARELCFAMAPGHGQQDHGIEVTSLQARNDSLVVATLALAADAAPGLRLLRVRTDHGLSGVELFRVGTRARVPEREKNDSAAEAQDIDLDTCVDASLSSGDVDYFALRVVEATSVRLEVFGVRLGDGAIDPRLAVHDEAGGGVAEADDCLLGRMDPIVRFDAQPGRYTIAVRDSAWRGAAQGADYELHVGGFPRPSLTWPLAVEAGKACRLQLLGDPEVEGRGYVFTAPTACDATQGGTGYAAFYPFVPMGVQMGFAPPFFAAASRTEARVAPSPLYVRVSSLETIYEAAKGAAGTDAVTSVAPRSAQAGIAFEGCLATPDERDHMHFTAKKGERLRVQVFARRLRSPVDAVAIVRKRGRPPLVVADDVGTSLDPDFECSIAEDGEHEIEIFDRLGSFGPLHRYRVEVEPRRAEASARILAAGRDEDHAVNVARAARMGLRITTSGVPAGTRCRLVGLPPKCSSEVVTLERGQSVLDFVVAADADAALASASLELEMAAKGSDAWKPLPLQQPVELVRVQNNQPYLTTMESRIPFAVTAQLPFQIEAVKPLQALTRGTSLALSVRAVRDKRAGGNLRLRALSAPPGIVVGTATLSGDAATLEVRASEGAALGEPRLHIVARRYGRNGHYELTSAPVVVTVVEAAKTDAKPEGTR